MFTPTDLLKHINQTKSVDAEFVSHENNERPCFTNWTQFLGKYITLLPAGFTSNYVFEFCDSKVTMQHLMYDDPSEAIKVNLCPGNLKTKKKKMCKELFGKEKDADWCVSLSDV